MPCRSKCAEFFGEFIGTPGFQAEALPNAVPVPYRSRMLSEFTDDIRHNVWVFPSRDAPLLDLPRGRVPQQFTAMIFRPALSFLLGVFVESDGAAIATSIGCTTKVDGEVPWITDVLANLPDMNLRAWVKYTVAIAMAQQASPDPTQWPDVPSDFETDTPSLRHWRDIADTMHEQPTRRRKATTPARLRQVATLYNAAVAEGRHDPSVAVAEAMHLSPSAAKKLVMQCRKATPPLLPPYQRRKEAS